MSHCPGVQLSWMWGVFVDLVVIIRFLILLDINLDLFLAFNWHLIVTELFCGDYS